MRITASSGVPSSAARSSSRPASRTLVSFASSGCERTSSARSSGKLPSVAARSSLTRVSSCSSARYWRKIL